MKITVTGGGGFLGQHLCRALAEIGHDVQVLGRNDYPELAIHGIKTIKGDIQDPRACLEACMGREVIFHAASKVAMFGRWEDFYATNVEGTKNLLAAAQEAGVKRFIYTSTPSVVFSDHDHKNAPQDTPIPPDEAFQSLYARSKAHAEKLVLAAHRDPDFLTMALRPHLIFGPGDKNIIPRLVAKARSGRLRRIGNGENLVDVIHVKNAVQAHLCALEKLTPQSPVGGKAYFLGQEEAVNLWQFINRILNHYQLPPVKKEISFKRAYQLGAIFEKIYGLMGLTHRDPPMTRFVAMQMAMSHYFDHTPAKRDLGYEPIISLHNVFDDLDPLV
jgi:2-alkyl-3-oxoalkanoate reductase